MSKEVIDRIRNYYDKTNELIVNTVGSTYQGGTLIGAKDSYRETNIYLANQAGIKPGQRVLDAGCGTCGPAIDIVKQIGNIQVDAVTISQNQAETGRKFVAEAGFTDCIRVHVGDYHQLSFEDETFDIVYFFESTGYSYNSVKLFTEVFRLLRFGGTLYIKDAFVKEEPLTEREKKELDEFNRIYVYDTQRLSETTSAIIKAGFEQVNTYDGRQIFDTAEFDKAIYQLSAAEESLTDFGEVHKTEFHDLPAHFEPPVYFAEIKAKKPSV
jgi:ubiquinone/menaquinone biosynthesis C-methylase UbiE